MTIKNNLHGDKLSSLHRFHYYKKLMKEAFKIVRQKVERHGFMNCNKEELGGLCRTALR